MGHSQKSVIRSNIEFILKILQKLVITLVLQKKIKTYFKRIILLDF